MERTYFSTEKAEAATIFMQTSPISVIFSRPIGVQYPGHVISDDQSEARLPTPRFTRTVSGPVVHLSSAPRLDVAPPSRIGDLLITPTDNKETAINNHNSEAPQHIKIFLPVVDT